MREQSIRRLAKALTARFVETVSKPGKYFDGQGLFLRVNSNGSRQWVQRITIRGKRCELGLGSPPAVSLATARRLALENRGKAMLGGDPLAEKRKEQEGLTFAQATDRYLAVKLTEFRNEKHRQQWRSTLDRYAAPVIGPKQVSEIEVQDVLRVLEPIWKDKTETASRLRGRIENVLSWATVAGHRKGDNPARWKGNLSEMLPKPSKVAKAGNQPALALSDVSRWWADLAVREGMAARALEFLTLTAARSGEVRGATWDEIDFGNGAKSRALETPGAIWTIPASRMKNGRAHRVPLSSEAIALLKSLPRLDGSPYVFFAPRGGMLSDMSISAVMRRMQEAQVMAGGTGYLDPTSQRPAVPHGLRSTFRQWAAERGFPRDMAEIALAHFIGSEVERAYQRSDMLDRRREMMAAWANFIRGDATNNGKVLHMAERE
ncbi:tyrosine-type recombinase/integrase [Ruegeria arenilitoris]|uniref:tyrosine-type recombinase/integrase n=1 Tax=Ruegeria arenilitoris TaxID=1173585 RepID=UPI001C98B59E|nr:site-specific integrase [Ruegeria arenilitoris]MBY6083628.1 integrase arm-type DNA-binding domain-containing protein [Ruegeria arenilitoris]